MECSHNTLNLVICFDFRFVSYQSSQFEPPSSMPSVSSIMECKFYYFLQIVYVQWGSEIWTSLDFKWSKIGWVANGLDFDWDLKFGSPSNHLKSEQMGAILSKTI